MRASTAGAVRLLTRTGLDWTRKYPAIAAAVAHCRPRQGYLDGELCGVRPDGITSFSMIQAASDGNAAALVLFLFDEEIQLIPFPEGPASFHAASSGSDKFQWRQGKEERRQG